MERQCGLIQLDSVSKFYQMVDGGSVEAVREVSLTVEQGEFFTIIGPSGCGKSTLLSLLAGIMRPSGGHVLVDGVEVAGPNPRKTAIVFQDASLFHWRTVLDNVAFGLEMQGMSRAERYDRAMRYVSLVRLQGFERSYPAELSGGMQQRVAIARALAVEPEILLMDEPFGALDEQTRIILGDELIRIWGETRKTTVFITHSLFEAVYLSDRVAVMSARPGQIITTLDVDVPRPRSLKSPRLDELRGLIWDHISGESMKVVRTV
ncbi:MAG: ABC transporter ATP-binding protein [Chloroflexi bacterium]|nr:ABC transporter ATP-binding protein [Chloroflexota bacterium]